MNVGQDTRFVLAPEVHTREFDGDLVILSLRGGDYFGVNDVGSRLWNGLVAGKSIAEVTTEIADEYDVPRAELLDDLVTLANELVGRGLLVVIVSEKA